MTRQSPQLQPSIRRRKGRSASSFQLPAPVLRACAGVAVAICLAGCPLAIHDAFAAGVDSAEPAKAEDLIRQANEMRRRGHDERALPLFRKAYEIAPSSRTAGQLGLAEMALGYWAAAAGHLDEALSESSNPWVEKNRATLDSALRTVQSHVAELRVEGKPDGAEVVVNGTVVGTLPLASPLRLREGRVNLEVRAPGRRSMTTTLTLAGHAIERVQVALDRDDPKMSGAAATPTTTMVLTPPPLQASGENGNRAGAGGPASGSPDSTPDSPGGQEGESTNIGGHRSRAADSELPTWRRVVPWALVGGAVMAGAIGVWQQAGSQDALTSFDAISGCGTSSPMRGTDPRCQTYYNDFDTKRTRAYISYGIGGALAAGAITMFIVNAVSTPGPSASAEPTGAQALHVVGLVQGGALFQYAGRF